jgi:hypothetical protein
LARLLDHLLQPEENFLIRETMQRASKAI